MNADHFPVMPPVPDEIAESALRIGRALYGGIETEGPQWKTCVSLARAAAGVIDFFKTLHTSTPAAFHLAKEFNRRNPLGTEGIIAAGDNKIFVRLDQAAMVFPSAFEGEIVQAWFYNVGWKDIKLFTPKPKVITTAEELAAMAQQARTHQKHDIAYELLLGALRSDPKYWQGMNEMGALLASLHRYQEAVDYYTHALAITPKSGEVLNNRGASLRVLGRADEALADSREAHRLVPGNDLIGLNCASALDDMDRVDEALAIANDYIDRHPEKLNALYNRSLLLLSDGRFDTGWTEFANRLLQAAQNAHYEHFNIPRWQGDPLAGKSVLIWTEQGLGDEIMTCSMVPDAIAAGAKVTLLVSERLIPLMKRSFPSITVDVRQSLIGMESIRREALRPELLPEAVRNGTFDLQMSQGDLGQMFRGSFDAFPKENAFLKADQERVDAFRRTNSDRGPFVGITWHSNRNPQIGKLKSLDLKQLAPILKTPGVTFVCLQYGDVAADIAAIKDAFGVEIQTVPEIDQLVDMDAFASLVAAMDLVITVSNTTAHLAGGLGVPTWVLTPSGPGRLWYLFRNREDWPWYPSAKLFRQPKSMKWEPTIEAVADELAKWAGVVL